MAQKNKILIINLSAQNNEETKKSTHFSQIISTKFQVDSYVDNFKQCQQREVHNI